MKKRKTRVEKNGEIAPLAQLKAQPDDVKVWAYSLRDKYPIATIRKKIHEQTGIYLGFDTCYSRFCVYMQQFQEQHETSEMVQEIDGFGERCLFESRDFNDFRKTTTMLALKRALCEGKNTLVARLLAESRKEAEYGLKSRRLDLAVEDEIETAWRSLNKRLEGLSDEKHDEAYDHYLRFVDMTKGGKGKLPKDLKRQEQEQVDRAKAEAELRVKIEAECRAKVEAEAAARAKEGAASGE